MYRLIESDDYLLARLKEKNPKQIGLKEMICWAYNHSGSSFGERDLTKSITDLARSIRMSDDFKVETIGKNVQAFFLRDELNEQYDRRIQYMFNEIRDIESNLENTYIEYNLKEPQNVRENKSENTP